MKHVFVICEKKKSDTDTNKEEKRILFTVRLAEMQLMPQKLQFSAGSAEF